MKTIVLTKLDQKIVSTMFYSMSKITKNISEDNMIKTCIL